MAAQRERKWHAASASGPIRRRKDASKVREDSEEELDALERRIAPEWTPLCGVQMLDGEGHIVFSRAYDRLDDSTLAKLADELRAAGVPSPRSAIIEDLADCRPGQRAVYEVDPKPELTPAEAHPQTP